MSADPAFEELRERLSATVQFLPDKPEENAETTLRALWHLAAGHRVSAEQAVTMSLPTLDDAKLSELRSLVDKRIGGTPLAHLTQRQRFMGIEMVAGAAALVPRRETEILARTAVRLALTIAHETGACRVVDVCTGSGNVAIAVAHAVGQANVFGSDLSQDAVELAISNARHTKLSDRVQFRSGDLLQPFETDEFLGKVDVLTCNPPYITSARVERMPSEISAHEPRLAFDGGPLGIGILMRFLKNAPSFVRPGGALAFEVGKGQGPGLVKRMQANPVFKDVTAVADEAGDIRVLSARC